MDQSPYLVQALRDMQNVQATPQGPSLGAGQLAAIGKAAKQYRQQNPGGSFIGHNLMQAGQNLMNAPGNVLQGLQGLGSSFLPGQRPQAIAPVQPNGPFIPGPAYPPGA